MSGGDHFTSVTIINDHLLGWQDLRGLETFLRVQTLQISPHVTWCKDVV